MRLGSRAGLHRPFRVRAGARQLGPHVHGHGRLNVAIEGKSFQWNWRFRVWSIVGFEHEASTPISKLRLRKQKRKLADGLTLFTPAAAAGCSLKDAEVGTQAEHEDEHEHEHEAHGAAGHEEEPGHHHSEFHVEYSLECSSPSRLTAMTFDYFKAFRARRSSIPPSSRRRGNRASRSTRQAPASI